MAIYNVYIAPNRTQHDICAFGKIAEGWSGFFKF